MAISEATRTKALDALEGMRQIVRREMLVKEEYVEQEISDPSLAEAGAICGGRKHCAIGSLWVGAGVRLETRIVGRLYPSTVVKLPGVAESDRRRFLRNRPGLRQALDALNAAAVSFAEKRGLYLEESWRDSIEALFEGYYGSDVNKRDLLAVIASAKRKVKAA